MAECMAKRSFPLRWFLGSFVLLFSASQASAKVNVPVDKFGWAVFPDGYIGVESSDLSGGFVINAMLGGSIARKVFTDVPDGSAHPVTLDRAYSWHAALAAVFFDRFGVGIGLLGLTGTPNVNGRSGMLLTGSTEDGHPSAGVAGLGGVFVSAKVVAVKHRNDGFGLAVVMDGTLNPGLGTSTLNFGADNLIKGRAGVVAEYAWQQWRIAGDIRYRIQEDNNVSGIVLSGHGLESAAAVRWSPSFLLRGLSAVGEVRWHESFHVDGKNRANLRYAEGSLAARYSFDVGWSTMILTLGGGGGLLTSPQGTGVPQIRGFLNVGFTTPDLASDRPSEIQPAGAGSRATEPEPVLPVSTPTREAPLLPVLPPPPPPPVVVPPPPPPPPVDVDRDEDGVVDAADGCPNDPEDPDGHEDDDGCEDPDNDEDGVFDWVDRCPNDPEDFDGFHDDDGCPEMDNDEDGIPDSIDECALDPEDLDGDQDRDGCPDD